MVNWPHNPGDTMFDYFDSPEEAETEYYCQHEGCPIIVGINRRYCREHARQEDIEDACMEAASEMAARRVY